MLYRQGFTLLEMIVVLIIVAVCAALAFPNFIGPTEQANALTAQNNLLAIYSAEKNYYNNHGAYYFSSSPPPSTTDDTSNINTALTLNIQTDGTYNYNCGSDPTGFICMSTRNIAPSTLQLIINNLPIQLNKNNPIPNPTCTAPNLPGTVNWCPN